MGNRSCNQQVHHHPNTGNATRTTKTFFLPMLCRLSLNDVAKPTRLPDLSSSSSSSISSSPDPSSPKISCIGQIKKRSNSTANYQFSASRISTVATGKPATNLNYTKLRKLFSSKNLISPPIDTATISNHGGKCTSNRNRRCNGGVTKPNCKKKKHMISIGDPDVAVEELDPPLPVVKSQLQQVNVSLVKRRGIELKILQIQPFQLSTTVHSSKIINSRDISPDQQDLSIR